MISTSLAPSTTGLSSVANLGSTQSLRPVSVHRAARNLLATFKSRFSVTMLWHWHVTIHRKARLLGSPGCLLVRFVGRKTQLESNLVLTDILVQ